MDANHRRLNIILALSAVGLPGSLRAAAVAPVSLAPALGMIQSVPAFKASVLSQISLVNSLSAQPVLTLSPIMTAAPTPTDPWRAEAARFVGALVARPQVVAAHQNELRAVIGDQGAKQMRVAAARFQAHAAGHPELFAQLKDIRSGLDLTDASAVQELGARLNSMFENSKSRRGVPSGGVVAASDSAQKQMETSWKLQSSKKIAFLNNGNPSKEELSRFLDGVGASGLSNKALLLSRYPVTGIVVEKTADGRFILKVRYLLEGAGRAPGNVEPKLKENLLGTVPELGRYADSLVFEAVKASRRAAAKSTGFAAAGPIIPSWFDAAGLSFSFVKKYKGGRMAVLRRARYELMVDLVEKGSASATFTKYALNPMGTPKKEEVALLTAASRKAVSEILRKAQASEPVSGDENAVLDEILAMLDGSPAAK